MATITKVTTPDGVTHTLGGGGGGGTDTTYDLTLGSLSSNTVPIKLEGSDGTTDTIYLNGAGGATLSVSGSTVTITTSTGQTITYTLSGSGTASGYTITATPSSGTPTSVTIPAATASSAGLMTSSDKSKLDGIESGAEANVQADWNQNNSSADDYIKNKPTIPPAITVDSALSPTSTNPVENQVIYAELETKQDDLISGTNIKTINGNSILGSGDLVIAGGQSITVFLSEPTPPYSAGDLWVSYSVSVQSLIANNGNNLIDSANNFLQAAIYGKSAIYVCINAKSAGDSFSSSDWKLAANENVQADWDEADPTSDAYILNKPTIPSGVVGEYVVEKGTNYIRYNSGLQICWINTTVSMALNTAYTAGVYQGNYTWTYPKAFISAPSVSVGAVRWGSSASWATVGSSSATSVVLKGLDMVSRASGSTVIQATAIGWWK